LRPWFSVSAIAIAAPRANVAGVVRLTCGPDGLEIELLRVTGSALGFAPGGVAEPVGFRVPYTAVRGLVREGRVLYLAVDPAVVTPYNRFALTRFAEDEDEALARAVSARARARWASYLLPAPIGAVAAAVVPEGLADGWLGRASVGALAALVALAALREVVAWVTWGGPFSDRLRDRFEAALAERLALVPTAGGGAPAAPVHAVRLALPGRRAPALVIDPAPRPAALAEPPLEYGGPVGRPVFAVLAAAIGIVLAVGFLRRYAASDRPSPPAAPTLVSGLGAAARSVRLDLHDPPAPEHCLCARADSPLWKDGVPVLGILTFAGDDGALEDPVPADDKAGFPHYDFDFAVVNNGARALRDVRITLTFARRNAAGRRVGAVDRGLFWGNVLSPGHAVKWHVNAPGGEVRVDASVTGTLAQAHLDPAPADGFFGLTASRFRAVRLHGAEMLAYLRDPRAADVARALAVQGAGDAARLGRIRRAAAPVIACDVRRAGERLEACVFNAASQPRGDLSFREVPASPDAGDPRSVPIVGVVPVHDGLRVTVPVPADLADEMAVVDPSSTE
jgi:hypothetical protein